MKNKTALLTGSNSDIAFYIIDELLELGYKLILTSKNINNYQNNELFLKNKNKIDFFSCDLTNLNSINELIKNVKSVYKSLDLIINIAGIWHDNNEIYHGKNLSEYSQKVIVDTYFVGVIAPTLLIHGLTNMLNQNSFIINISGTFENGSSGWVPYYVSKRAIEDFTVAISQELTAKDIYSICISPSDTATRAYKKFFPNDIDNAQAPSLIANFIFEILTNFNINQNGQTFVIKKDREPFTGFHY